MGNFFCFLKWSCKINDNPIFAKTASPNNPLANLYQTKHLTGPEQRAAFVTLKKVMEMLVVYDIIFANLILSSGCFSPFLKRTI